MKHRPGLKIEIKNFFNNLRYANEAWRLKDADTFHSALDNALFNLISLVDIFLK